MPTKKSIADQILLRISKGYHDSSSAVQLPDVIVAIGQKCNEILKQEYFTQIMQLGETIPDGIMLASYFDIPVTPIPGAAKCTLPAMPVMLPKGIGVYEVFKDKHSFIPIQPGQAHLLKSQNMICDFLGNIGFEQHGKELIFTKDITVDGIDCVNARLAVTDINSLSDYDVLPIDAGIESMIVEQLVQQFSPSQTNDDKVDNINSLKQTK